MPRARDHFADFLHSLAARFFFPLGFKFCCMVLRVANTRALVIDLRRLCYLQWITTRSDSDNCTVIRVSTTISCTLRLPLDHGLQSHSLGLLNSRIPLTQPCRLSGSAFIKAAVTYSEFESEMVSRNGLDQLSGKSPQKLRTGSCLMAGNVWNCFHSSSSL